MFGDTNFKKMHELLDEVQMALRVRPEFTDPEESRAYFNKLDKELADARRYMEALLQTQNVRPPVANDVREQMIS